MCILYIVLPDRNPILPLSPRSTENIILCFCTKRNGIHDIVSVLLYIMLYVRELFVSMLTLFFYGHSENHCVGL